MNPRYLLAAAILMIFGCQPAEENPVEDPRISEIENNLVPGIMIEGHEYPGWTIQERMKNYRVPGVSIAFFEDGRIAWTRTYGYLDTDSAEMVNVGTRFQAASISKPVAASGMMALAESGKFDIDADVNTYLSEWKMPGNPDAPDEIITLRRLVTHNAGLTVHGFRGYAEGEDVPSTLDVLQGNGNSDAVFPDTIPGSIWRYSGGGYTLMQYVIEENIDESFPEFMRNTVLDPVGMERSTYVQPLPADMRDNTSIGHRPDGNAVKGKWHTYPEMAAAGLWTTPTDLSKWALAMQRAFNGSNDEFIQPETARKILTKHMDDWGLGPALGGEGDSLYFRHGGANEGYRCMLFAQASEGGQGIAIMTNSDLGGALMNEIIRAVDKAYGWNVYKPALKTVIDLDEEELAAFEGVYHGGPQIEVNVFLEDGQLKGRVDQNVFLLYPEAPDQFFDDQDGQSLFFHRTEDGTITGFTVEGIEFERQTGA